MPESVDLSAVGTLVAAPRRDPSCLEGRMNATGLRFQRARALGGLGWGSGATVLGLYPNP